MSRFGDDSKSRMEQRCVWLDLQGWKSVTSCNVVEWPTPVPYQSDSSLWITSSTLILSLPPNACSKLPSHPDTISYNAMIVICSYTYLDSQSSKCYAYVKCCPWQLERSAFLNNNNIWILKFHWYYPKCIIYECHLDLSAMFWHTRSKFLAARPKKLGSLECQGEVLISVTLR